MGHTKKGLFYKKNVRHDVSKEYAQDVYHDRHKEGQIIIKGNTAYKVGERGNWIRIRPEDNQ